MNDYSITAVKDSNGTDSNSLHSNLREMELIHREKLFTIDESAERTETNEQADQPEEREQAEQPEKQEQAEQPEKQEQIEEPVKNEQAESIPLLGDTITAPKEDVSRKSSTNSSSDGDADTLIINKKQTLQSESKETEERVVVEKKANSEGCLRSSLKICFPVEFKRQGEKKTSEIYHWDLMKNIPFLIFCSNGLLYLLAVKVAFLFLPAIAMSKGFSRQQAALILTIIGGTDTFARIAIGFLMDLKPLRRHRHYLFTCLLYLLAVDTLMIPLLTSFTSVSIVCAIYGFLSGAFMAQRMVFLVDILGREKVASALGIQRVFQGVGTLVGPPIAGALRDALGNYDSSFYLGGGSMLGSALLMTLCVVLLKIQHRKSAI